MSYYIDDGNLLFVSSGIVNSNIPSDVTSLGSNCFGNSSNSLVSVDFLGSSVKIIGDSAFLNCFHLTSVRLDKCEELHTIQSNAFRGCLILESVVIPTTMKYFGPGCFRNTKLRQTIQLSEEAYIIFGNSFLGTMCSFSCHSNNQYYQEYEGNIYLKSLTNLVVVSFSTSDLVFPPQTTTINEAAFSSSNITEIRLPKTITTLSAYSFHCANFTKTISIPGSVTIINQNVFSILRLLDRIIFSEGTTTLVTNSIVNCPVLRVIIFPSTLVNVDINSFIMCPSIEYVSYFSSSLIETYHLGGIPLHALLRVNLCSCKYFYSISYISLITITFIS